MSLTNAHLHVLLLFSYHLGLKHRCNPHPPHAIFHSMYLSTITSSTLSFFPNFYSTLFPFLFSVYFFFKFNWISIRRERISGKETQIQTTVLNEDEWICVVESNEQNYGSWSFRLNLIVYHLKIITVCTYISLPLNELEVKKHCWNLSFYFSCFTAEKQVLRHSTRINMTLYCKKNRNPQWGYEETNGCKCCTFNFIFRSTFFSAITRK